MKDMENINIQLIEDAYQEYRQSVASYIYYKIGNKETSEDLAQDVFLRLMDYRQIVCAESDVRLSPSFLCSARSYFLHI